MDKNIRTKIPRGTFKITIYINKILAKHLSSPHTFYDGCEEENIVMRQIQKEIDKEFKNARKK